MSLMPPLRRKDRQVSEFQESLVYRASFRKASAAQGYHDQKKKKVNVFQIESYDSTCKDLKCMCLSML